MEEEELNPYIDDYPFIGRTEYLEKWEKNWKNHKIFGIFGMQCVGKSRTVWEFLRWKKKQCEEKCFLKSVHIDLRKVENLDIIRIRLLAEIVGHSLEKYEDDTSWMESVISAIKENSKTIFAIVMDNAEDIILGPLKDKFLTLCQKLVFSSGVTNVKMFIVSTCEFLIASKKRVFFKDEMKPMNEDEGMRLLKEVVRDSVFGLDEHAAQIVKLSGSLPSVIIMSGSEMTEDGGLLTPTELIELLMKCRLEILSREFYPEEERTDILMKNFINRLSTILRDQMAILSYIPGTFDDETATGMLDHESPAMAKHKSLIPLRKHHMLEYDQDNRRFNIHGLLKDCLNIMDIIKDYPMVRRRYTKVFYAIFDKLQRKLNSPLYQDALKDISLEHQNLQKLMTDVEYSDYETFPFFVKMVEIGQDVLETHLKSNCFEFFEKCLQLTYKFADKTQKATVLIGYGRAQTNIKGNYESGQEKLCQAIEVLDDLPCTYATAQAYQSLGFTLQRKGEVEEALRCLEEALKIETELDIPNNRLTLSTLSSLGIVNVFIGNFEDGKKYHLESLKRRLALLQTEKHPHIGACYNNLGLLYENMGEYDKALEYYEKGLQVKLDTKAPLASRLISVCNVAMQYMLQGNLEKAYKLIIDAENELKGHLHTSTFIESFIKDCLAQVLIKQGKYHEALGVIHSAILIRRLATPNNLTLTESLYHRANAYRGLKNYKSAKTVLNRALEMSEQSIKQMPRTMIMLRCYELMLDIHIDECDPDRAAGFYVKSKQELIRILGLYQKYGCPKKEKQLKDQLENLEQKWNDFLNSSPGNGAVGQDDDEDLIAKAKQEAKQKLLEEDSQMQVCDAQPQRRPELWVNTQRRVSAGQSQSTSTPQSSASPVFKLSYVGTPQDDVRRHFPQHRPPLALSTSTDNETVLEEKAFPDSKHKDETSQNANSTTPSLSSANQTNDLSGNTANTEEATSLNCDKNNFQNNANLSSMEIANLNQNFSTKDYRTSKDFELSKFGISHRKNSQDSESKDFNKINNITETTDSGKFTSTLSIEENDAYICSLSPNLNNNLASMIPGGDNSKKDTDPNETIPKTLVSIDQNSPNKNLETRAKEKSLEENSKIDSKSELSDDPNSALYWNSEFKELLGGVNPVDEDESEKPGRCDQRNGIFSSLTSTVSKFFSMPVSVVNSSRRQTGEKEDNNDGNTNSTFSPFSI